MNAGHTSLDETGRGYRRDEGGDLGVKCEKEQRSALFAIRSWLAGGFTRGSDGSMDAEAHSECAMRGQQSDGGARALDRLRAALTVRVLQWGETVYFTR